MFIDYSLVSPFSGKENPFDRDESTQLIVTFSSSRNRCFCKSTRKVNSRRPPLINCFLTRRFTETINHDIDIERSPTRRILDQRRPSPSAVAPFVTVLTEI